MIIGYMRISTNKETQKHDRQELALKEYAKTNEFQIDRFYADTISGKVKADNRPQYIEMRKALRAGDTLLVSDLDRLGRDADDTIKELKELKSEGIRVIALDIPYMNDYRKIADDSMYQMIVDIVITLKAHMAQQEREKIVNRINQGLAVAKENGTKLGRPKTELPNDFIKQYEKYKSGAYGDLSATGFAKMLGIARSTLYKYINLYNMER